MPTPLPQLDDPLEETEDEPAQPEEAGLRATAEEPSAEPAARPPDQGPYRRIDPLVRAERIQHEREVALANQHVEEAIRHSRREATSAGRKVRLRRAALLAAMLLADGAVVWWALGSVELTLLSFVLVGLGFFLVTSIDTIKPSGFGPGQGPPVGPGGA